MTHVGACEAKTLLSSLLDQVAAGKEIITTAYLPTFAACRSSVSEHVTTPSVCAPK